MSNTSILHLGGANFVVDEARLGTGVHTLDITISTEFNQVLRVQTLSLVIPGLFDELHIELSNSHHSFVFTFSLSLSLSHYLSLTHTHNTHSHLLTHSLTLLHTHIMLFSLTHTNILSNFFFLQSSN